MTGARELTAEGPSPSRQGNLRAGQGNLRTGQGSLCTGQGSLRTGQGNLRARQGNLRARQGSRAVYLGSRAAALLVLLLACACAKTRTVVIHTERPAAVLADGKRICDVSPCPFTFSRETCGLFDSSRGYLRFDAEEASGDLAPRTYNSPMYRLCDLRRKEHITIPMQPETMAPEMPAHSPN